MSDGPKKLDEPVVVTMTTEEFGEVCQRVHTFLIKRAERARQRREYRTNPKTREDQVETAKDVFAFVHLMEMVDHMSEEIANLRQIIAGAGIEEADPDEFAGAQEEVLPEMFAGPRKQYLN